MGEKRVVSKQKGDFLKKRISVLMFIILIFPSWVFGWGGWKTLKSAYFTVIYKPGYEIQAWEALRNLEYYRPSIEKLTSNRGFHLPVVIEDVGTVPNGFSDPIFFNTHLFTYPPTASILGFTENWWSTIGGDAIGDFSYFLTMVYDFNKRVPKYSVNLTNNFFAPLQSYILFTNIDRGLLKIGAGYPFINKISPGLSELWLGLSGNFHNDFSRREVEPYLNTRFRFPKTYGGLRIGFPVERKEMGSNINRMALYTDLFFLQYLPNSQLSLDIHVIYDPDNSGTVFTKIRGYKKALDAKIGATFELEYSRPLLRIRKGIWNPNIFFEDLGATLFVDGGIPGEGKSQLSTGIELHLETKAFFFINIDIGVRIIANRERKTGIEVIIGTAR